jgi:SAM-dependent methyltransferase
VRHKSSYLFFRKVIAHDLLSNTSRESPVRVLDIGCGVGHGTWMLADIPGVVVTGIDCSEEAVGYAKLHYGRENITYVVADAVEFIRTMSEFDYVVSRHALEHVPDGVNLGAACRFSSRLMVNVPFAEQEGNPHHFVHFIRQDSFERYPNRELFYEDLDGVTFCDFPELTPNSIVCVSSRAGLPKVSLQFSFPLPPWQPEFLQARWLEAVDRQSDFSMYGPEEAGRDGESSERQASPALRETQIAGREARVGFRESEIATRENQIATREADLASRESHVGLRESEIASRESRFAAIESASSLRARDLDTRSQELVQLERQLNEQHARLSALSQKFEGRVIVRAYRKLKSFL